MVVLWCCGSLVREQVYRHNTQSLSSDITSHHNGRHLVLSLVRRVRVWIRVRVRVDLNQV